MSGRPGWGELRDLLAFLRERRRWFLAPVVILLLAAAFFVVAFEIPALAPFIYALF